jgi:hypothetical protein
MICSQNEPVRWNHIYQIAQKIDDAGDRNIENYQRFSEIDKKFNQENFTLVEINYRWEYNINNENSSFCSPINHGILTPVYSSLSEGEKYVLDSENDLFFVGSYPNSGTGANEPCYCCIKAHVSHGSGSFSLMLSDFTDPPTGGCDWVPKWQSPCDDLIKTNQPTQIIIDNPNINQYVSHPLLCNDPSSQSYQLTYIRIAADSPIFRLRYVDLFLNGYFGWPIRKHQFNTLRQQIQNVIDGSCPTFETILRAGEDSPEWVEKMGECPNIKDVVWTKINKNNEGQDPGCFEYNESEEDVLNPWEESTCGGSDCLEDKKLVYCKTIENLESVTETLVDYFKEKDEGLVLPDCCYIGNCNVIAQSICVPTAIACAFFEFTDPDADPPLVRSCPPKYYRRKVRTITGEFSWNIDGDDSVPIFDTQYSSQIEQQDIWTHEVDESGICQLIHEGTGTSTSDYQTEALGDDPEAHVTCTSTYLNGNWSAIYTPELENEHPLLYLPCFYLPLEYTNLETNEVFALPWEDISPPKTSTKDEYSIFLDFTEGNSDYTATYSGSYSEITVLEEEVPFSEVLRQSICNEETCSESQELEDCRYCCTERENESRSGVRYVTPASPEGCVQTGNSTLAWNSSPCDGSNTVSGQSSTLSLYFRGLVPGTTYRATVTYLRCEFAKDENDEYLIPSCSHDVLCNEEGANQEITESIEFEAEHWAEILSTRCDQCDIMRLKCQLEDEVEAWNANNPEETPRTVGCSSGGFEVPAVPNHYTWFSSCKLEEI